MQELSSLRLQSKLITLTGAPHGHAQNANDGTQEALQQHSFSLTVAWEHQLHRVARDTIMEDDRYACNFPLTSLC